ncbi:MAG: DUF5678 domain-containing protein [Candidatus Gracilibacteria bacterium]|jgi:hypothetical protein
MKIDKKYLGKWIAVKNDKVIASDKSLRKLTKSTADNAVRFTLIPKGLIAG